MNTVLAGAIRRIAFLGIGLGLVSFTHAAPGTRGVSKAFASSMGVGNNFAANKATLLQGAEQDYILLETNGFGHCRIGYRANEICGAGPDFTIPPAHLDELQQLVDWCLAHNLKAVVDPVHNWCNSDDPLIEFDPAADLPRLGKLWQQVAERFASYPLDKVAFEIINEPHEDDDIGAIIANSLPVIRGVAGNENRQVIIPGDGFSTRQALIDALDQDEIPANDPNIIATFHFYDPHTFTSQTGGIEWGTQDERDEIRNEFAALRAANQRWAVRNNTDTLPIYLGEYGADKTAPAAARVAWLGHVSQMASDFGFTRCHWEMYSASGSGKGTGPWDAIQKSDPSTRTFDSTIVNTIVQVAAPPAVPHPLVFQATEDTFVRESTPTTNFGAATTLELRDGDASNTFSRVAYFKFEPSGLMQPASAVRLFIKNQSETDPVELRAVADTTWTETGMVWNTRPAPGPLLGTAQAAAETWLAWDVAPAALPSEGPLALMIDETANGTMQKVYARESGFVPYLSITEEADDAPVWNEAVVIPDGDEGQPYSAVLTGQASDPDSTSLYFAKVAGPGWVSVTPAGVVGGVPDSGDTGTSDVTFSVYDGFNPPVLRTVSLTVSANAAPVFSSNPMIAAAVEDLAFSHQLSATDANAGDALVFSGLNMPSWLTISPSGLLAGTPGNQHVGSASFTVVATDELGAVGTATFEITVANTNDAPVIAPVANQNAVEDALFSCQLAASDVDAGDSLTFAVAGAPTWLSVSPSGLLSGTPLNQHVGVVSFTVRATDTAGAYSETGVQITVANTNDVPVISTVSNQNAIEDALFSCQLTASDVDAGDSLTFTASGVPTWLSVSPSGLLAGTPLNQHVGVVNFTVRATDAAGAYSETGVQITVVNANDAPVWTVNPISLGGATIGVAYSGQSLAGLAGDPDSGDTLTYGLVTTGTWLSVAGNGVLSGTPSGSAGIQTFTVKVTDLAGASVNATLNITVAGSLPSPWVSSDIGTTGLVGAASHSSGTFTVSGAGAIGGSADACRYVYQTLTGDGSIVARVSTLDSTGGNGARVGIQIRDTLAANSKALTLAVDGTGGYKWMRRTTAGGSTSNTNSQSGTAPNIWIRLVRSGSTVTASKSSNGTSWTSIGSVTVTLNSNCYIGLAVGSGTTSSLNASALNSVTVVP